MGRSQRNETCSWWENWNKVELRIWDGYEGGYAKKSGHFKFYTVSLLVEELHANKILLFLRYGEEGIEKLGSK